MQVSRNTLSAVVSDPWKVNTARLCALLKLAGLGWAMVERAEEPLTKDSTKYVECKLPLAPCWYYNAMLHIDEIFEKPASGKPVRVLHRQLGCYYEALVKMKDLTKLMELTQAKRPHRRNKGGAEGYSPYACRNA